mgnify:FL=1
MTKKILASICLLALAMSFTGCAGGAFGGSSIMGSWFTDAKLPIQANSGSGSKEGKACANSILGIVATGDASIEAAMADGGIKDVTTVDYKVNSILGLYATLCTIVKGK